ncbi:MAG TPA: DUF4430 domain-containing protein [Candidatus Angelobacter sp.]|nr:DUF4430 domain-containing protein [Candidatus Angelobacter sp.]
MKKRIVILIISALLIIGAIVAAVYLIQSDRVSKNAEQSEQEILGTNDSKQITYQGKEGVTALVLLKQIAEIETDGSGLITSIDGVAANPKNQYWEFFINDKSASEGAGSYITKDSNTINWKLSSF